MRFARLSGSFMTSHSSVVPAKSDMGTGVTLILFCAVSIQFGAAFAVYLFPYMGAWGVTAFRLGVAALIMLMVVRPRVRSWSWDQWRAVLLFGLAMAGMNGFFYQALSRIPLGLAVAVEFAGPLLLSIVLSQRRIDLLWSALASLGLGILGFEALSGSENINLLGLFFAFIAGLFWAAYILYSARVGEVIDGAAGLSIATLVAMLVILPLGFSGAAIALADPKLILFAVLTGLLSSAIPYSLEFLALRKIPRNVFSILLSLEPAVAALAGWILLHQATGLWRWIAIFLLIAASIGITRGKSAAAATPTTELEILGYDESTATGALPTTVGFQTPIDLEDPHEVSPLTQPIARIDLPPQDSPSQGKEKG